MKRLVTTLILAATFLAVHSTYVQRVNIGIDKGLSCNAVKVVAQDSSGRLWVGTENGVNCISNSEITRLSSLNVDGQTILTGDILAIACAKETMIATHNYILCHDIGNDQTHLVTYQDKTIRTDWIYMTGDTAYFYNTPLSSMMMYDTKNHTTTAVVKFPIERGYNFVKIIGMEDDPNQLLLIDENKGFYTFNLTNGKLSYIDVLGTDINSKATFIDSNNILWVAHKGQGISGYYIKSGFDLIAHFDTSNSELTANDVNCLAQMPSGNLLVCTAESVYILNRKSGKMEDMPFGRMDDLCVVNALVDSQDNNVILCTINKGLVTLRRSFFHLITYDNGHKDGGTELIAKSAWQDEDGTVWVGSRGLGLFRFDEETEEYSGMPSTNGMTIVSLTSFDQDNLLLVDITNGMFLFNKHSGKVKPASFMDDADVTLSRYARIKAITTPDGDIMLFNLNGRHLVYRIKSGEFSDIVLQLNGQENSGIVDDVKMGASHTNVTCNGNLYQIDNRTLLARLIFQIESGNTFEHIVEDSHGMIWACSPERLICFDPRANKTTLTYNTDNNIGGIFMDMVIDAKDKLWITTSNSLILMFDTQDKTMTTPYTFFGKDCGVQLHFASFCNLVTRKGLVYFPHANGVMVIDPSNLDNYTIHDEEKTEGISLDKLDIDGNIIMTDGRMEQPLKLSNRFSSMKVRIVLKRFDPTVHVPLQYTLLRKGSSTPYSVSAYDDTEYEILNPTHGSYRLMVSEHTTQGLSEPQELLSFTVSKPFIMTVPAYLLMLVIIISISLALSKVGMSLKQIDVDRAMNRQENKHKDDKIALMTNLAHDLRTPLSIMYNPLKDMIDEKRLPGADTERLQRVFNQVNRMTEMVEMILNKGNSNLVEQLEFVTEKTELNSWLAHILEDAKAGCTSKGLKLRFIPSEKAEYVNMDPLMMEAVVNSLMNNAIKFSDTGTINVSTGRDKSSIWIKVTDEGRGFNGKPSDLFLQYYREDDNLPGHGLGLTNAKQLINSMGGTITAQRNDGPGSTFTITIPDNLPHDSGKESLTKQNELYGGLEHPVDVETTEPATEVEEMEFETKSMSLLIVDDQEDILQFIKDEYSSLFKVIYTARDGKEALEIVKQRMPSVVVSDIMMPRMNGFELCRTIKTDLELSSIPVILLTSRSDPKNQDMGYKMGADSFLPKPFDAKLLYKIIRSQLKNRFEIKRQYASSFFTAISEDQTFSAADEQFVLKLNKFIRENLSNTMLGVDMITEHMGVSRTTLFNKMNSLIGVSTNKYIRRIRIETAKEMLSKTSKPVGTIADETGFSESQYFSTVFKQETGMTPSQFKESLRN